ncbi:LysR family transcriptional regulator [Yinghuangia seranimata]|uniref:LysR family transcriptional regulator n=1 Tax=Yinghuangia seranimata TaxID=408067 RepID=UPI00248B8A52|nr:LysR family transcriptional regulator [Yinghuangia seranimata]MDI2132330.1 LysR family transcriptional regulator [Yinghuangia seranimata]
MLERHEIEAFLAVAEELHFARAADRLLVSRARVSQTIQKIERYVGAPLFERTSRKVLLTPLGARLYEDLRPLYDGIGDAIERARATARGVGGVLRVGIMGAVGHLLIDVLDGFAKRHPDCEVQIREVHFSDPFGGLRSGEIDLSVLWMPVREPDLTVGPVVHREGNVLCVSARHRYAGRESVSLEDLADELVVSVDASAPVPAYWQQGHAPAFTKSGAPIRRGPSAATFQELLTMVATEQCISFASEHVVEFYRRPSLAYVPIRDADPILWGLVWRTSGELHRVRAFAEVAAEIAVAKGIPQVTDPAAG